MVARVDALEPLVWLDLETTGLDERTCHILEIACVVTAPERPFAELGRFHRLVRPSSVAWRDELVVSGIDYMHDASGLVADVELLGRPLREVRLDCCRFLDQFRTQASLLRLAGSGIAHFDRHWLRRHMPEVEQRFGYATMDVGHVRRLIVDYADRPELEPPLAADAMPHRAMSDVLTYIAEFRRYVELVAGI